MKLAVVAAILLGSAAAAFAEQGPTAQPPRPAQGPAPRDTVPARDSARRDSARRDSARRDSAARDTSERDTVRERRVGGDSLSDSARRDGPIVDWADPDSVMQALMSREGYSATRYQGDRAVFRAETRNLELVGAPSAVGRDETVLVGDTIVYDDSTQRIVARGDTLILRDPGSGNDDLIVRGRIEYDISRRAGIATDLNTAVESGQRWVVHGHVAAFRNDTTGAGRNAFYARGGWITSCEETEPHYHFASSEMKVVSKSILVARPAVLYIGDIPVMWLPFVFQDLRSGRRSGILPPRFQVSDIIRNSPSYRRSIEDFGYYFNLGDFFDAEVTTRWRSGARSSDGDPGYFGYNGVFRYKWIDRFLDGEFAYGNLKQNDGQSNMTLTWNHRQEFSSRSRLTANLNYSSNTSVQRRTTFDPLASIATIGSNLNYQQSIGPLQFSVGGDQRQYPGRDQIDRTFPSINLSTKPIEIGEWFTWTPTFSLQNQQSLNNDQASGALAFRFQPDGDPRTPDSVRVRRDQRTTAINFDTPITLFGWNWRNSFSIRDEFNDFPQEVRLVDPNDANDVRTRIFSSTYATAITWQTSFTLPSLFQGTWNLAPNLSFDDVGSAGFLVRNSLTGTSFARGTKRPSVGLSSSPTFFALFPGFGAVSRFRHGISPTISFRYSPKATVSDDYLRAIGQTRERFLGLLPQNAVSLNLSTNLEAKLRQREATGDSLSTGENQRAVKVLSLNFSSLEYDFQRKKETGLSGFTTDRFGIVARSDLLPGFDVGIDYDLFQGDPLTDTAVFKPYREGIRASLSLDARSGLVAAIGRLLGFDARPDPRAQGATGPTATDDTAQVRSLGNRPILGSIDRAARFAVQPGQGWRTQLTFTSNRTRPAVGLAEGSDLIDPSTLCQPYAIDPTRYQQCLLGQGTLGQNPLGTSIPNTRVFRYPAQTSVQGTTSFNITPKWAAQWSTTYDFVQNDFASHVVSLQRELHDWNAIFAFTQSPNGNFAFNFFIALKAQPELKFDYRRVSFPRESATP